MIIVEKLLTALALPGGLIWLGLIALAAMAWRRKQKSMLALSCVLLAAYTAAGNGPLGRAMLARLERDYAQIRPLERGPFDAVVVLGGGTSSTPGGLAQLDQAGDRVALAARLYHAGRTERVIVTGERIASLDPDSRNPAGESAEVLDALGVPPDRIVRLPGRNTSEEMAALARWSAEHPQWSRLGVVTSARHMARALRLAEARQIRIEPLPADFRGQPRPWTVVSIVPSADGFQRTQAALKETLARCVGR